MCVADAEIFYVAGKTRLLSPLAGRLPILVGSGIGHAAAGSCTLRVGGAFCAIRSIRAAAGLQRTVPTIYGFLCGRSFGCCRGRCGSGGRYGCGGRGCGRSIVSVSSVPAACTYKRDQQKQYSQNIALFHCLTSIVFGFGSIISRNYGFTLVNISTMFR